MNITTYHIDAFTNHIFSGNPAMVCLLESWLPDSTLQIIAAENNLPVTAFLMCKDKNFSIRWFTPEYELDLCGHGTLASGYVIFNKLESSLKETSLHFKNGLLKIKRECEFIVFDFPTKNLEPCLPLSLLNQGLGKTPQEIYHDNVDRYFAVFNTEEDIQQLKPNIDILRQLDYRGIIVTAPGKACDFVSRVFYPRKLISEDAVTGASHCFLVPYWAKRLNKRQFQSRQLSQRGGELLCELDGDRVVIKGKAVLYMQGLIVIDKN